MSTAEIRSNSALFKREEQLRRWQESDTNKEPAYPKHADRKIKFSDGCIFLAACAANDREEVSRLIAKGADIDTGNVDGLTALHQACIDDNLEMVEFLVASGADINRGDNEGWTPLHATASCGFLSIARFLIESGARVDAANNDGDLPLDVADSPEMQSFLQNEIDRRGIDPDEARHFEERQMLSDANQWLNAGVFMDSPHPETGATALHVAAAKGYLEVIRVLLLGGADPDAQDFEGWTPLHAAAHWAQREAIEVLTDSFCDMEAKNCVGQTPMDVADPEVISVLEECRERQATLRKERPALREEILARRPHPPLRRRTSVTRMSGSDKSNIPSKDASLEREALMEVPSEDDRGSLGSRAPAPVPPPPSTSAATDTAAAAPPSTTPHSPLFRSRSLNPSLFSSPPEQTPPPSTSKRVTPTTNDSPLSGIIRRRDDTDVEPPGGSAPVRSIPTPEVLFGPPPSFATTPPKGTVPSATAIAGFSFPSPTGFLTRFFKDDTDVEPPGGSAPVRSIPTPEVLFGPPPSFATTPPKGTVPSATAIAGFSFPSPTGFLTRFFKSFVPPVRDDESETQRKAHAKRVRETRRSTQGVTLEDIRAAQQTLRDKQSSSAPLTATDSAPATSAKEERSPPPDSSATVSINMDRRPSWKLMRDEGDKTKFSSSSSDKENKEMRREDSSASAAAAGAGAAISRKRRPKRRSTGVVQVDLEEIDPDRKSSESPPITTATVTLPSTNASSSKPPAIPNNNNNNNWGLPPSTAVPKERTTPANTAAALTPHRRVVAKGGTGVEETCRLEKQPVRVKETAFVTRRVAYTSP
ncbi:unnamed protein product [Cyprideis torosa]|uniref:Protein phosphatase 1 regulatory subunit 12B n=2 Tax=Cyprideis torosa TaxID=163714 RepID=A0A7R8W8B4_9CRUS|nr:unnamed protein product [Cyprideis torosa]CAG0888412.1 unnamed protein product [Cyprideis torosa]